MPLNNKTNKRLNKMISIIIPTYNEAEVIVETINKIKKTLKKNNQKIESSKYEYEIIVADDNSPDKTWQIVNKTFSTEKNIYAIRRQNVKKGLGPSVVDGFNHAQGNLLFVIDGDGQHDESKIPAMIKKIEETRSDIVIGTRFRDGGSVKGWSKKRILISKTAALMAKPLLSQKISDPMSGFFAITKKYFNKSKKRINPLGYKILLEFLFAQPKAKITEVGFKFKLREKGESKLGSDVIIEYIHMLIKQGLKKYNKFIKFCVVGLTGIVVNIGLLYYLTEYQNLYYIFSSGIAIEISIITNFILNNFWTWTKGTKNVLNRLWKFNAVSIIALGINIITLYTFTEILGIWYIISNLIGILAATLVNFIVNDRWTFK